jgi:hypothetical protein
MTPATSWLVCFKRFRAWLHDADVYPFRNQQPRRPSSTSRSGRSPVPTRLIQSPPTSCDTFPTSRHIQSLRYRAFSRVCWKPFVPWRLEWWIPCSPWRRRSPYSLRYLHACSF